MNKKGNGKGKWLKIRVNGKLKKIFYSGRLPRKKVVKNNLEYHDLFGKKPLL